MFDGIFTVAWILLLVVVFDATCFVLLKWLLRSD